MAVENWYEYPSNFSNGTSVDGVGNLFNYASYVSGGFFGIIILAMIFLISMSVGIVQGSKKALTFSSFITTIFAVYLASIGLVELFWVFLLITLTIVSAAFTANSKQGGL